MKRITLHLSLVILIVALIPVSSPSAQEKNLSVNPEVTARIRVFDREFFKNFDVYSAGVQEAPTALLFDLNDNYHLPSRFWGSPLSEEEIIYAIRRLDDQYIDHTRDLPFVPRALTIVNKKGAVVGYVYTGMGTIMMDRKKDGRVIVFLPSLIPYKDDGDERYFRLIP